MKIKISRQSIYLITLSTILLLFVVLFSFLVLIPEGKKYREHRVELQKENKELTKYQNFHDETLEVYKQLQADNRHVIEALKSPFNIERFEKLHKEHFQTLIIAQKEKMADEETFSVYEVKTTSHIHSPQSFYDFLDAINKSEWVIGINFPIHFVRDGDLIKSSFTMRVYAAEKKPEKEDLNVSELEGEE
ncbi:MAG: hypothetical protein A2019_03400 [Sulfurimonas sp. GWF2_37_8]|nr:MAG: hypothetical protein A2019_03400 [Sulfurimonas sp. GWF2_37_8]